MDNTEKNPLIKKIFDYCFSSVSILLTQSAAVPNEHSFHDKEVIVEAISLVACVLAASEALIQRCSPEQMRAFDKTAASGLLNSRALTSKEFDKIKANVKTIEKATLDLMDQVKLNFKLKQGDTPKDKNEN